MTSAVVTAEDWYATMPIPDLAASAIGDSSVHVRRYTGTAPLMEQPALSQNLLCMHLGGAKHVRRWNRGRLTVHDVEAYAMTIMPAGESNRWLTSGPIDFAHLQIESALLERLAAEEFDREPRSLELMGVVGQPDPLLERLFRRFLLAVEHRAGEGRLYPESVLVVLVTELLAGYCNLAGSSPRTLASGAANKGGLPPWRLRRVVDFMLSDLSADIGLADLTRLTGLSRAQFFRAFKQSTGQSPHRYLTMLRLSEARRILDAGTGTLDEIAAAVGLGDRRRLSTLFRRRYGSPPQARPSAGDTPDRPSRSRSWAPAQ